MSDTPPPEIILEKCLPLELVEDILSRLPVKSLKRFRAVEKSWCRLIDSENFAKTHLHRSLASNSNRNLISGSPGFRWLSVDSLDKTHSVKLEFEYDNTDANAISNSCNGLVVVTRDPEPPILFNPFSREYKVLPSCPQNSPADSSISCKTTYGFGYDSKNDDYKVVKVLLFKSSSWMLFEEWIYSLRSDCWRRTKGTYYGGEKWPPHVNGALHTIVQCGRGIERLKIMGYSVETEEDYEVARPEGIDTKGLDCLGLNVLDGHLALVCVYPSRFIVWMMETYGVKESWVQRISFGVGKVEYIRSLVCIDSQDKILVNFNDEELILLDVRKGSEERFKMPSPFVPRLCVETLVSPHGLAKKYCSDDKLKKEHRNKEKKEMMGKKKKKKRDEFLSSGFKLSL